MSDPTQIQIEDYDYPLPAERIAQYPLVGRDASRLLFYNRGLISDKLFSDLPELLPADSLLVFNDTRVIRARFEFHKSSGARIEVFCLEPIAPTADLQQAFSSNSESYWKCYIGNLKKWKSESITLNLNLPDRNISVVASNIGPDKDAVLVRFSWNDPSVTFAEIMEQAGHIPLPPYITRPDEQDDTVRYQTVYARSQGSVAAPTAGLHFTDHMLEHLGHKRFKKQWVTLHVGAGTFKPVKAETIGSHDMHFENYSVSRELIAALLDHKNQALIPVGTTSTRTLESLYWLGLRIRNCDYKTPLITTQWEPYNTRSHIISKEQAFKALLNYLDENGSDILHASTGLLIAPGYTFRVCTGLITNFHQPKSTLLLLVAALVGPEWQDVYSFALEKGFRFLSYGDSSLLIPRPA